MMPAYLEAALEDGDPRMVAAALGDSPEGNPEMATFLKVVHALGFQLHANRRLLHSGLGSPTLRGLTLAEHHALRLGDAQPVSTALGGGFL